MTPRDEAMLVKELLSALIVPFGAGLIVSFAALWLLHRLDRSWLWMLAGAPLVWLLTYVNPKLASGLAVGIAVAVPFYVVVRLVLHIEVAIRDAEEDDREPFLIRSDQD